ncbi:MAG: hypothetical protein C4575_01705 [Desulforudis sp.]|jgi:hypothetical protein|nr:MAG: hypothetical protein C4575_01705 [Desulforudis sp.]
MAVNKQEVTGEVVNLPTKQDVRDFVNEVRAKALDAVKSKAKEKLRAEFEAALAECGLDGLVEESQGHLNSLVATLAAISEKLDSFASSYRHSRYAHFCRGLTRSQDIPVGIKETLFESNIVDTPAIQKVREKNDQDFDEVKDAYRVVINAVENMRSVEKMVKYLDSLGFDTSYLCKPKAVDAEKLFPCKERA